MLRLAEEGPDQNQVRGKWQRPLWIPADAFSPGQEAKLDLDCPGRGRPNQQFELFLPLPAIDHTDADLVHRELGMTNFLMIVKLNVKHRFSLSWA